MTTSVFEATVLQDSVLRIATGKVLDNGNAHQMVETLQQAGDDNYRFVILNMKELEFLSSAGVGSILSSVDMFRQKGGDIVLCNVSSSIRHIFTVLDVADFLVLADDEASAISACGGGEAL